jgi:glycosyltransferase involved in cell wall biosynthesis
MVIGPIKPRIAILADFPWSFFDHGATGRGGGQACTWLSQLAEEFAKQNIYEIHWISINHGSLAGIAQTKEWGGQYFHLLPGLRKSIDLRSGFRVSRWQLMRILKKIEPVLVHCWGTETAYPTVCGQCSVPVILSMQGILSEYDRIGALPDVYYWKKLARRELEYLRRATVVTCESQWGIEQVKTRNPFIRTYQVEYGVHSGFFDLAWTPDLHSPFAVYAGSIDFRKGVDLLMDALSMLDDRKWRLIIMGEGPLRASLESKQIKGVEWHGVLDWEQMQKVLTQACCIIVPTRSDSGPSIVKECRVMGLPVIGTRHGGLRDYIHDGENGFIVDPLEPAGLAYAMSRLMDNPELAKRMGAARHAEDRAYFRPENTARGFMEIYDELLA